MGDSWRRERPGRPREASWGREFRDLCEEQGVRFFFKQWGGARRKAAVRKLDGMEFNDMPLEN